MFDVTGYDRLASNLRYAGQHCIFRVDSEPGRADGKSSGSWEREAMVDIILDFSSSLFLLKAIPANSSKIDGAPTEIVDPFFSTSPALSRAAGSLIIISMRNEVSAIKLVFYGLQNRLVSCLPDEDRVL